MTLVLLKVRHMKYSSRFFDSIKCTFVGLYNSIASKLFNANENKISSNYTRLS